MARSIVLSNGELAVALDGRAQVRDVYFPHVGLEDHVRGHYVHRIGVWTDGTMSWLDDPAWNIKIGIEQGALASAITASNPRLGVELSFTDVVHHEQSIFFRRIKVTNLGKAKREIKLYVGHQFEIYKAHGGDTAYYDPASHSLIHYKGRRTFQIRAELEGRIFDDYAIGIANFHGKEGAWRDAEDGALSKNPIEHGPVDSVLGLYGVYGQGDSKLCHYWMVAERSVAHTQEINEYVTKKTPEYLIQAALSHWRVWSKKHEPDTTVLSLEQRSLFTNSMLHLRAHVDDAGGVIASLDSDMLQYGLDTYSYVWPRDGAYAVLALGSAGETAPAKRLFDFCSTALSHDGYLMHKYLPDGSLGSSWHPWIRDGKLQLPIQEDETALIIHALHEHYKTTGDSELAERLYGPLVEKAAQFFLSYRDKATGLPDASYDLWEEKRGISTYTASAVYGALVAAAELSKVAGKTEKEQLYRRGGGGVGPPAV
jgi:GH15 family glucan-1,4-alpha-glucosidase